MIRLDERLKTVHRTEDEDHLVFLNYARSNSSAGTRSAIRWQTWCASCLRAALTGDADAAHCCSSRPKIPSTKRKCVNVSERAGVP